MSKPTVTRPRGAVAVDAAGILADLRELIHSARRRVATVANAEQTLLYWRLGKRIAIENLTEGRAEYGKQILATVSQELMAEFGKSFSYPALTRMAYCLANLEFDTINFRSEKEVCGHADNQQFFWHNYQDVFQRTCSSSFSR